MAISTLVTATLEALQWVLYICYPVKFQRNEVQALIDSKNKVNAMTPVYTAKLDLTKRKTSVRAKKIEGLFLDTYSMISASFLL